MIKLSSISVGGFRLLEEVEMAVESGTTVIVGRNNSGKTSLTELFEKFLGETPNRFRLEDFSAAIRNKFFVAKSLRENGSVHPEEILSALPSIYLELKFTYRPDSNELGPLSPFIIDLDQDCNSAIARLEYSASLSSISLILDNVICVPGLDLKESLFRHLREVIQKSYSIKLSAIDPTDRNNVRHFENLSPLSALLHVGFVKAQRTLDLNKRGDTDVIGKLLNNLFRTANTITASTEDQELTAKLKESVASIEASMQDEFDTRLKDLLPALNTFGFPSLNDTELRPQTSINVEGILSDHTKILYTGADGVHLPEGYNGLGTRNLIYILLHLETLHKSYRSALLRPATHLIFLEEPEAHLHPQMQEVFITQLNEAIATLSEKYPDEPVWRVQFVVSTHSSHLANAAPFEAIRYFLNEPAKAPGIRRTKIKDFRKGAEKISISDRNFLQQYMTLTKCDLYFADKAILVEGATERILMPRIIKFVDEDLASSDKLSRQYITTMEVGGMHAQIFYLSFGFS